MSKAPNDTVGESRDASNRKGIAEINGEEERPTSQIPAQGIDVKGLSDDPQEILLQSFWPTIAVYSSADTEELVRLKGIYGGFCDLLKPFGERIYGKVNVRDSAGGSRSWDDFGVHFTTVKKQSEYSNGGQLRYSRELKKEEWRGENIPRPLSQPLSTSDTWARESSIDGIMQTHLRKSESALASWEPKEGDGDVETLVSPHHIQYLRKVLAPRPMTPHDTFTHPVACLIVTTSQSPAPIEKLRDLYSESRHGDNKVPAWAGTDFLRYYVLVHDEDHDDIARSIMIYEQMKRHFGLHCHLLRLRSTECSSAAADGTRLPRRIWPSLEDDVIEAQQQEDELLTKPSELHSYLFSTDVNAITTFVREMITQSLVPFMEGRVTKWNDQVVSRRRGISGRFMSLSKRWTGFGSSRGASPSSAGPNNSKNSNFNYNEGYYLPDSPEATMQRLADYAFMLRDWKLSSNVYDLLRNDFADDKAWMHQAFVSQMAVTSLFLDSLFSGPMVKMDLIDQSVESTLYSYTTRCADTAGAIRFLVILIELFMQSGAPYHRHARKWTTRLLELSTLSPSGQAVMCERLAGCYSTQRGLSQLRWAAQSRKAAFWSLLAAHRWNSLGFSRLAQIQWRRARKLLDASAKDPRLLPFSGMQGLWDSLSQELDQTYTPQQVKTTTEGSDQIIHDGEKEQLCDHTVLGEQPHTLNLPNRGKLSGNEYPLLINSLTQPDEDGFS